MAPPHARTGNRRITLSDSRVCSAQQPDADDHQHAGQRDPHHGVTRARRQVAAEDDAR